MLTVAQSGIKAFILHNIAPSICTTKSANKQQSVGYNIYDSTTINFVLQEQSNRGILTYIQLHKLREVKNKYVKYKELTRTKNNVNQIEILPGKRRKY